MHNDQVITYIEYLFVLFLLPLSRFFFIKVRP